MNIYTFLNEDNFCCNKKKFKLFIYDLYGAHISDRMCVLMSIYFFTAHLFVIDLLLWKKIISTLLYLYLQELMPDNVIVFLANTLQMIFFLSIFSEAKILLVALKCKCLELEDREEHNREEHNRENITEIILLEN